MAETTALIAMSGGVDSSVAAYLAQQCGHNCIGATMRLCDNTLLNSADETCQPYPDGSRDAQTVARKLGIPFHVFDHRQEFRNEVVERFVHCYEQGGTPNPCVDCNKHIKFQVFWKDAQALGCDLIVTGHYAQIKQNKETGRFLLYRAMDNAKDQSYFLACLNQQQLGRAHFPLGALTKEEVRTVAQSQGFITAQKKDSQDICFIPNGDYKSFMEEYRQKQYPGGIYLDLTGNPVGKHAGAVGYTIGQRKGLGLAMGEPVYVCHKDMVANTVTVGPDEALYRSQLRANNWNWIAISDLTSPIRVQAKVRYRHKEQPATVYPEENGFARVVFDEPQRAITTGQAVVLYDGDMVVGSGTIKEVL